MQANHDVLWAVAVAAAWIFGHLAAPFWMPVTAASLVAVSLWLDRREEGGRSMQGPVLQRATIKAMGRCSVHTAAVLTAYVTGLILGQLV